MLATTTISALRAGSIARANVKAPGKASAPKAILGQPFEVERTKSVFLPAQNLKITFERVVEDSRCPSDVECFWAGQATVTIRLDKTERKSKTAKKLATTNLTVQGSKLSAENSVRKIGSYWIKLLQVAPEKGPQAAPGTVERITLLMQDKPIATPKSGQ